MDFHYRRLSLTARKFLGIELSYFSITSMLFFSLIPSLFPKRDGHGLGVKLTATIYMGIAKPMRQFSKHSYSMLLTCPLRIGQFVPILKKMVSHNLKRSLIFYMTVSITSIVSILAPSSHEHQP